MCLNEYTKQNYIISDYYSFIDMNDSAKTKKKKYLNVNMI